MFTTWQKIRLLQVVNVYTDHDNLHWFTVNSLHCQFAPVNNSQNANTGRVGIQCYQPNFWRLTIITRDSDWISSNWPLQKS